MTEYGKKVKIRLIELEKNQTWLIERVTERTGLFMDNGYMQKILSGQRKAPKILEAINEILNLKV